MKHMAAYEPFLMRVGIALVAFLTIFLLIILPVAAVFVEAFSKGVATYFESLSEPDAAASIWLTVTVAAIAVPFNLVFGVAASWAIAKFEFSGKRMLLTFIDLPFSVSPVISGLCFILLFGAHEYSVSGLFDMTSKLFSRCQG
jgi:sulfate transport system permease protein